MEELINLLMEIIKMFPWVVVLITVRTVYGDRPKKTKIQYKDFSLETIR